MTDHTLNLLREVRAQSLMFHQWCLDHPDALAAARAAGTDPTHGAYIEAEATRLFEDDLAAAELGAADLAARAQTHPTSARAALRQLSRSV